MKKRSESEYQSMSAATLTSQGCGEGEERVQVASVPSFARYFAQTLKQTRLQPNPKRVSLKRRECHDAGA